MEKFRRATEKSLIDLVRVKETAEESIDVCKEKKPHFKKLIDMFFLHLTIANMVTIVFILIPDIMASFGVPNFLDDVGSLRMTCFNVHYVAELKPTLSQV
ncbi:hypothetical protein ACRRTK_000905 [Alexandromys fortis]